MTDSPAVRGFWTTIEVCIGPVNAAKPSQRDNALYCEQVNVGFRDGRRVSLVELVNTRC